MMKILNILKTCCMLACLLLAHPSSLKAGVPMDKSQQSKPATIKILLLKDANGALIEAKGRYHIYNGESGLLITTGIRSLRHFLFAHENGIKWGDHFPGIYHLRFVPGDSQCTLLVNGVQYKGCLDILCQDDAVTVINEIDVENFLKSTLTSKFPKEHNSEVMDAVAIVERTNAYHFISKKTYALWHVAAQEIDYQGYGVTLQNPHLERAIENTRYMVMTYKDAPFAAQWTANSAGKTASFTNIFRKQSPTPSGVSAPFAARDRDKHSWSLPLNKKNLASLAKLANVTGVDLYIDRQSEKVYAIRVEDGLQTKDIDFFTLQKALGSDKLKSNDFTVELRSDLVLFKGFGQGHGVGLCLYSAELMARRGDKTSTILSTFFPHSKLQNIRSLETQELLGRHSASN